MESINPKRKIWVWWVTSNRVIRKESLRMLMSILWVISVMSW